MAETQKHIGLASPRDHSGCARSGSTLGCQNLGKHAATPKTGASASGHGFQRRVASLGLPNKPRGRILARIGAVEPLLIGQDQQRIGFHEVGHQRTQCVVVAKLDFVVNDCIVFIDHWHHAQLQQR